MIDELITALRIEHDARKSTVSVKLALFIGLVAITASLGARYLLYESAPAINVWTLIIVIMALFLYQITKDLNPEANKANKIHQIINYLLYFKSTNKKLTKKNKLHLQEMWDIVLNSDNSELHKKSKLNRLEYLAKK
jgi:hypothetical protein